MMLRNFLFLDTSAVDDYLAALQGSILDGPIEQTETGKSEKGGKAGYKIIEGNITSETSTEKKQKLAVTDAAKFQQLYEIIENQQMLKFLDLIDEDTWSDIRRGDLLEIEASIRLPEWFTMTQLVDDLYPLIQLMTAFGQDPLADPTVKTAIDGISGLAKITEKQPVPLLFEATSTPGYSFSSNLSRQYFRIDLKDLNGEAIIFGKVQKILKKGEKQEVFSILPGMSKALPNMNKTQQRKIQQDAVKKGLSEIIQGPAIILTTVAIYR